MNLKLSAPKETTWIIAVIAGVAGILMYLDVFSIGGIQPIFLVGLGFVLLAIATTVKGL
jgi:hypothetical protein